ncbi:toll/interleukin-1 receptor-like protein [Eucalyptus grandis]|uniref:toll/interleukin-1 receptor-like protein n=1 Tax=Eucalyptus grandis TaxID=71139 RepID=UPI00192EDA81|nr:toll/interleukin-1 receptor-like protein [Eucalyptus grandis]
MSPPDYLPDPLAREEVKDYSKVFLSFRGRDTRTGLADLLHRSLVKTGIRVYRDKNELCRGKVFGLKLLSAITRSRILILIISENYGSKAWCLCELAQMMECRRNKAGYTALPVFYGVKPCDVRHQAGRFGDGFQSGTWRFDD